MILEVGKITASRSPSLKISSQVEKSTCEETVKRKKKKKKAFNSSYAQTAFNSAPSDAERGSPPLENPQNF